MDETRTEYDPQQRREALFSAGETREDLLRRIVAAGAAALAAEIAAGKSERLLSYLAFSARFYHYSAHNQILIAAQCPEATFVAGYRRWQRFGYQVRRGERGIRIFAPRPFQKGRIGADEEEEVGVYFVAVAVFDLSQVEPIAGTAHTPIQPYFTPLGNEASALVERLGEIVVGDGIAVSEADGLGQVQGYSAGGRIVIKAGLDPTNRFLTLLHEYGHELLHQHEAGTHTPRSIKECEAEAVSFIVARYFGIHNPFAADYLQTWGNTGSELIAQLEAIQQAASYIIEAMAHPEAPRRHPHTRRTEEGL